MASVTCPICGNNVTLYRFLQTANKPFCTKCGWNIERARIELATRKKELWLLLSISGLSTLAVIVVWLHEKELPGFFPLVQMAIVITFAYSWNSLGIKRAITDARLPNPKALQRLVEPKVLFLQKIASLERPRRVVLRFAGALATLFLIFIFFAQCLVAYLFAAYGRGELPTSDELFPLLPLLALMVILAATIGLSYRTELKKLPLIRDGQFVAARVVEQRVNHRGKQTYNQITYEFQEPHGPLVRKTERDHSRLIFEDMLIPVFYNPTRPYALRCAQLTIVCPTLKIDKTRVPVASIVN
jgi:hypothetical protein